MKKKKNGDTKISDVYIKPPFSNAKGVLLPQTLFPHDTLYTPERFFRRRRTIK